MHIKASLTVPLSHSTKPQTQTHANDTRFTYQIAHMQTDILIYICINRTL